MKKILFLLSLFVHLNLFSQNVYFNNFKYSNSYTVVDGVKIIDTIYIKFKINYQKKKDVLNQIDYIDFSMGYYNDTIEIPIIYSLFVKKCNKLFYYEPRVDSTKRFKIINKYSTVKTCIRELKLPKIKYAFFTPSIKLKYKYINEGQNKYFYGVKYSKLIKDMETRKKVHFMGTFYAR